MAVKVHTSTECSDIAVNTKTGEAFISQRKLAELLNVSKSTISSYISRVVKDDTSHGLTSEMMQSCVQHYALNCANPPEEAKQLLRELATAGAKAYLYHEAGYVVSAAPIRQVALPEDYVSALRALADKEEQRVLLMAENQEKHIETDSSETYFTVRKARNLNPTMKLEGKLLVKRSEQQKVLVKQVFDLYDQEVNSYHRDVWLDVYPDVVLPE